MTTDAVLSLLPEAERQYWRLILVVGGSGSGKTRSLRDLADALRSPIVNVGRDLAQRLLPVAPRFRSLEVARDLDSLLPQHGPALLDNTEILFDQTLEQEPLLLL